MRFLKFIAMIPWFFLLSFFGLLFRFKLKYGVFPSDNPISPKDIGMSLHVGIIDTLMMCTFINLPLIGYLLFTAFKTKDLKLKRIGLFSLFGTLVCFYFLKFSDITEWYFN